MMDGAVLLLLGTTSLPLGIGRGSAASLLVAYWMAMLSSSSVVYLKMSFGAWKGGGYCALCTPPRTPLILSLRTKTVFLLVIMSALAWVPCVGAKLRAYVPLTSLTVS
jgi:hypothetical protein